jgi:acetyl esterase/lipase
MIHLPRLSESLFILAVYLLVLHPRPAAQTMLYLDIPTGNSVEPIIRTDNGGDRRIDRVGQPYLQLFSPPEGEDLRGAALICPGGGYSYLSVTKEGEDVAAWLAENGFVGLVLGYRLPHEQPAREGIPVAQRDGLAGILRARSVMDSLGIDAHKLIVIGFSAGGHLAASLVQLAQADLRPNASVLIYPVISMREEVTHGGSRRQLLGEAPTEEMIARYSTDEHVKADYPPTLLVHSSDDRVVPVANSLSYYRALQGQGVRAALLILERGNHGYGMRADLGWTEATMAWLSRQGF